MLPFPSLFHRQIINRHGMALTITNDGTVKGLPEDSSANKNAILEFSPTEPPGKKRHLSSFLVCTISLIDVTQNGKRFGDFPLLWYLTGAYRIRGVEANLYLAMDTKGRLYGESDRSEGGTVFAEHSEVILYWYTVDNITSLMQSFVIFGTFQPS